MLIFVKVMKIWKKDITISQLNERIDLGLSQHIGIEYLELGDDFISARMPVDHRTHQPMGLLHGGASAVLAETLGSIGSLLLLEDPQAAPVGLELNCNHIKSIREGWVIGTAKPIHIGRKTHVWNIEIRNENQELICVSRLTTMIIQSTQS